MIILQLVLYCLLFTAMVKLGAGGNALNCLYFYPKPYREKVYEMGLADRETIKKKRKSFMVIFYAVMISALVLIIGAWNRAATFSEAYWQALLFLEVMNWHDGIVIDRLWVGHSDFWHIDGVNLPYVQSWRQVLKKRGILTLIMFIVAAVIAALTVALFG